MIKTILKALAVCGSIYLLLNLYAYRISDKLLFAPQPPTYTSIPHEFQIESGDGERITAVLLEHPETAYTILFSHGNAEDLGEVVPFMQQIYDLGYSVLMYDYRGYGTSEGKPSTVHAEEDAPQLCLRRGQALP